MLLRLLGTASTEYHFTGQQDDADLGLTYLQARYYDPTTGRFISKDPFPGALATQATLRLPTHTVRYWFIGLLCLTEKIEAELRSHGCDTAERLRRQASFFVAIVETENAEEVDHVTEFLIFNPTSSSMQPWNVCQPW